MPAEAPKTSEIKVAVAIDDLSKKTDLIRVLTDEIGYNESEIVFVDPSALEDEISTNRMKLDLLILSGSNRDRILQILSGNTSQESSTVIVTHDSIKEGVDGEASESYDPAALSKIQELLAQDGTEITQPTSIEVTPSVQREFCFYDAVSQMPSLTRNNGKGHQLRDKLVGLFDVDGTLAQAFVMGRFVQFLSQNDVFDGLLRDSIPASQRAENKTAMNDLINITGFLSAPAFQKKKMAKQRANREISGLEYETLIERLNLTYATMLKGMDVRKVCELGYRFSRDDVKAPHILMPYAKPVINLAKKCGMVTSLLTGMPAEAIGGYKEELDIRERCYPLELTTTFFGGKRIYSGGVANSGGLAGDKLTTARDISTNGNDVVMYMGDQESDLAPMYEAMKEHSGIFGLGFLMTNPLSENGQELQRLINGSHLPVLRRGQLVILDKDFTTFLILKRIISDLHMMSCMRTAAGQDKAKHAKASYRAMKKFLEDIMLDPLKNIQNLYKPDGNGDEEADSF